MKKETYYHISGLLALTEDFLKEHGNKFQLEKHKEITKEFMMECKPPNEN